ncbi:Multimodular transpeptidase-transglycosylase [hydrothermal vent metagenome]|uniref:peptidoglycan glycosyltransferase n=1 Tax=hydrothermal vent metagenome TaxID=652676 RepID=A0A1W1CT97_9ZZZZ
MLELRFSKKDILNLYLNTVYFGQDGKRAIHGFALASQFYFNEPIENISIEKMALLVAMVKGAYAYHPISQPKNAKKRRNLVLRLWSKKQNKWVGSAIKKPLGVLKKQIKNYYTSAIELAKNEIKIDKNKTYKIVLSLDIKLQNHIREQTLKTLKKLERGKIKKLQTAIIIADKKQAKVKAILGDRYHRKYVFNRAIMAKRQIGSLIKPFIYLTALAKPEKYFLYSILKDDNFSQKYLKITKKGVDLQKYQPKNYDKKTHGNIALINALAKSYNIPAVKLGLELGIKNIIKTLQKLGLSQEVEHLPSLLLGALNLTPLEIANLYQTLMNDGQLEKLSIIDSVWVDNKKQVFKKENKIVFNSAYLYLLKYAMKNVVKQGTAKALRKSFDGLDIAGKTGSSNDFRDSWFVGIGDEYLATIWLGRDDNKPMYLSGSRGAMKLFIDVFKKQGFANLTLNNHKKIEMVKIMFKNKCVEFPSIKNQQLLSNKEKCE